jgi:hypothetical protein
MSAQSGWLIEVTGALAAHFTQPDGSSKPGMDWAVSLTRASEEKRIMVRAYDEAVTGASPEDGAQLVCLYVASLLKSGWSPDKYEFVPGELIYSSDIAPPPKNAAKPTRPWWRNS